MRIFIKSLLLSFLLQAMTSHAETIQAASAKHGMTVSEVEIASRIGANILRSGGNAIDAAVAVGYALAVVNPCCGNLGGGGFMTIHFANGKSTFINFREKAAIKASKNMYLDIQGDVIPDITTQGYLAVAVPGTVLGLDTALKKYGSLSRKQVMTPAIKLAKNGYKVTPYAAKWFKVFQPKFQQQASVANIFLKNGNAYKAGDILIQKDLAHSLDLIAAKGPQAFYKGEIAKNIVKSSKANGGILTLDDFANYNVEELTPLYCEYRHYKIISAPLPSSGGITLCEMLNILDNFSLQSAGFKTPLSTHYIIEAMRYGFEDRNAALGDPDFVANPTRHLISKKYAKELSNKIKSSKTIPHPGVSIDLHSQTDTTHYSVIDKDGNAVAVTFTLNGFFGAKVIAEHTGFFLNDEMDDFTVKTGAENNFELIQSYANAIQPGKRPLSSMAPTIVLKDDKVFLVLGSPGGPRIITSVLLTILNVIDYNMSIKNAVDESRFHFQELPDYVNLEPQALPADTLAALEHMGYQFRKQSTWSAVEAIMINPVSHLLNGANDYRRPDGAAIGY